MPLIAVTLAASVGELVIVRGLSPYLAVGVSLLVLLTLSLILKALTVTEIGSMVKLAIQTVSPIMSWRRRGSDLPLRPVASEEEQNPTVAERLNNFSSERVLLVHFRILTRLCSLDVQCLVVYDKSRRLEDLIMILRDRVYVRADTVPMFRDRRVSWFQYCPVS